MSFGQKKIILVSLPGVVLPPPGPSKFGGDGSLACFIQNPKLSVLITCLVEGAIQGVTNSGNVKSALGLAKSRLGYNM